MPDVHDKLIQVPKVHIGPEREYGSRSLRIVVADRLSDLDIHAAPWNRLCASSKDPVPRYSYTFLRPYFALELKPGERWLCLFAYHGLELVGVLPFVISPAEPFFRTDRSRVNLRGWAILAAPGREREVAGSFLSELPKLGLKVFCLSFPTLHDYCTVAELGSDVKSVRVSREFCGSNSFLPIPGDFDRYFQGLDRTFRQNLRRWEKKLVAQAGMEVEFLIGHEVTDERFEEFLRLEASGWKGQQGTAVACTPAKAAFYRAWLGYLRDAGWPELHVLKSGGQTIAAHFAIRIGKVLTGWKIAYDEQYRAYAPGNLLVVKLIEHLATEGQVDELDAITSTAWHRQWQMNSRPYFNVYWYPRSPYNFLFGQVPMEARRLLNGAPILHKLASALQRRSRAEPGPGQNSSERPAGSVQPLSQQE